jgi:hypothetical protein
VLSAEYDIRLIIVDYSRSQRYYRRSLRVGSAGGRKGNPQ